MVVKFYCNYCGHIPGIGKSDLTSRSTLSVIDDCGCRDSRLRNDPLSSMIVDVVTLACVTICRRPPNKKWIFGYGKIETVVHLPLAHP